MRTGHPPSPQQWAAITAPLADLREDNSPNRQQKIDQRTEFMLLETPIPVRYLLWLRGIGGCLLPFMSCDLGQNRLGQDVSSILGLAMSSTLRLVLTAALVAIVIGNVLGSVVLVGLLNYVPALALGPVAEHLTLFSGK